jgi:hypothetical protein
MPAVKLIKKSALAAEVPGPVCLEMKDALSCMDTPPASAPGLAGLKSCSTPRTYTKLTHFWANRRHEDAPEAA